MKKVSTKQKYKAFKMLQASNAIASLRLEGIVVRLRNGRAIATKESRPERTTAADAG